MGFNNMNVRKEMISSTMFMFLLFAVVGETVSLTVAVADAVSLSAAELVFLSTTAAFSIAGAVVIVVTFSVVMAAAAAVPLGFTVIILCKPETSSIALPMKVSTPNITKLLGMKINVTVVTSAPHKKTVSPRFKGLFPSGRQKPESRIKLQQMDCCQI